jgi:CheY-like chemotaxis protein
LFGEETVMPRKVLVVEDICELLELLGKVLASRGWDAILADSGQKALNKLEYESPNVILLDMRLPDINGFELAAILKKHPVYKNIPILAASGYSDCLARDRCLAAGCDDFISKPFALSALETRLTYLVSARRQNKTMSADLTAERDS